VTPASRTCGCEPQRAGAASRSTSRTPHDAPLANETGELYARFRQRG